MKKFYVNFITSYILYNQIYCADSNIKIKKGKLKVRYRGYDYKNIEEINIDKNKEIDIDFIKDLVRNKKLKDGKYYLNLDEKCNYEIKYNDKKEKYYINDFLNKKVNGSTDGYYIKIQKYYILPKESEISIRGYSADLGGQKVYLEDFKFKSKTSFVNSVFKIFKSLKLENKDYNPQSIEIKDLNSKDYYIDDDDFYKEIKNEKYDKNKNPYELDENKFKTILDKKLNIYIREYKIYKIKNLKLDERLERKFKITEECKNKLKKTLTFKGSRTTYQFCNNLKKYIEELKTININESITNNYLSNNNDYYISDNDLDIVITSFYENKAINIVPKTAEINITSKENIFIIDKDKYKSKVLDFVKDNIDTDTVISDYIDKKYIAKTYPKLQGHYDLNVEGDNGGKFKDGTKITITIRDIIPDITTNKNQNKIYVKVKFEVSDNTKYKLKENILKLNNHEFELEKDSKYENLIEKVKENLENTAFKDGFTVLYDNSDFIAGNSLTNDGIYTFKLDNLDTNFVEEIVKEVPKEEHNDDEEHKDNEEEHIDDEEHNNDDNEQHNEDINNINNTNINNNSNNIIDNDSNKDTKKSNNGCNCCDCNKKSEK